MTVVGRLFSRLFLRPGPSLLLLGAAILASNWVWYGSGIFLGRLAGLALTVAGVLGHMGLPLVEVPDEHGTTPMIATSSGSRRVASLRAPALYPGQFSRCMN